MASVDEILKKLEEKAKPDQLEGMARYGMTAEGRLGVSIPEMRKMAKEIGKDHKLAPELWNIKKIHDWSKREEEFVKRAAYALIACLAWHDKEAGDEKFTQLFPVIKQGATDERKFVKKAVNWALRNIGKRNLNLNKAVIKFAKELQQMDSKAARWIASDAIRKLESDAVQQRIKKVSQ